jgi:putative protease
LAPILPLKPGDGVVFDEGHPDQDEQGGRVYAVRAKGPGFIEIELGQGQLQLGVLNSGVLVWKTDDPKVRKMLEQSFAREAVVRRVPLTARVKAHVGAPLEVTLTSEGCSATAVAEGPLAAAQKHPVNVESLREQLGRLGETPYELASVTLDDTGGPMVPKSLLNDLRRRAVEDLMRQRATGQRLTLSEPDALDTLRQEMRAELGRSPAAADAAGAGKEPRLTVLVRTEAQLAALLAAELPLRPSLVYCDYEDVRRYPDAVLACRRANVRVALATLRIVKPSEHGLLKVIADADPDAVLIRNLAALAWFQSHRPDLALLGDYALNVANELTAGWFFQHGVRQLVPSYDLNFQQLLAMLGQLGPAGAGRLELVLHQHMPMFHMEHCVFAHTLSQGKDYRDCGRPCDTHKIDLRDRVGQAHPLVPDTGCRNTLFNAEAQTAATFTPELTAAGIRTYRVELLREDAAGAVQLLERYGRLLLGQEDSKTMLHSLRVLNQLGVTSGTMAHA